MWPGLKNDFSVKPKCVNVHDAHCLYFDYSTYCNLIASSSQDHTLKVWKAISYIVCFNRMQIEIPIEIVDPPKRRPPSRFAAYAKKEKDTTPPEVPKSTERIKSMHGEI